MLKSAEPEDWECRRGAGRLYDLMESDPAVAPLRAMHSADQRKDAKCMSMAHEPFAIGESIRGQWLSCMYRALDDCGVDSDMQALLRAALERMTAAMVNRA